MLHLSTAPLVLIKIAQLESSCTSFAFFHQTPTKLISLERKFQEKFNGVWISSIAQSIVELYYFEVV